MTNHWKVIEDALSHYKSFISDLDEMSFYDGENDAKQAVAGIEAAIVFVKEQRLVADAPQGGVMSDEAYDSYQDTREHQGKVYANMQRFYYDLWNRSQVHDDSKSESPEKEIFDAVTPKLKGVTYGSDEYKAALAEMGEALQHHYEVNSHHPEHYPNGVEGMNLMDLVEMFCDWKAASERHANGDFAKSLEINKQRFAISDQLVSIFENTRKELGW